MKYGDTLRQRSIPEWAHYNIDYDHLKELIKHHTAPGGGTALSIPGQGAPTERAFSESFFKVLKAQHDRINLFVKSKSGEIERRLGYIGKQLAQTQAGRPGPVPGSLPARTVEKYAKIEADAMRAGEEIRSLSRFRIAQRIGFTKILKKYKRWTNDRTLERRFKQDVISKADSFYQLDLGYLLDQYIDVLGAVRASLQSPDASNAPGTSHQASSASRIYQAVENGTPVEFDMALNTVPLGPQGSRSTYWVHVDHIVEVEVLLLQHMRLYTNANVTFPLSEGGSPGELRLKRPATATGYIANQDDVGMVVLDDASRFAQKQNTETVGESESGTGSIPTKASGLARWAATGPAAVAVGLDSSHHPNQDADVTPVATVEQKHLRALLDTAAASDRQSAPAPPEGFNQGDKYAEDSELAIHQWLSKHPGARPIACVCSKRTRFVGLHNTVVGGVWATLDRDISLRCTLPDTLGASKSDVGRDSNSELFPHAVIEIRREGTQSQALIHALDHSHLVERVRGFSLETQAVWTCGRPSNMSPPIWLALLEQDIRKLPAPVRKQRRTATSTTDSSPPLSRGPTSTSVTSVGSPRQFQAGETSASDFIDPPPLRAFRKKRRNFAECLPPDELSAPNPQRYWNEYDNPESGDEGYYIYLDPNSSDKLPGQETLEKWAEKAKYFLRKRKDEAASPLLSAVDDGSSDDDSLGFVTGAQNGYGTMGAVNHGESNRGYLSNLFRSVRSVLGAGDAPEFVRVRQDNERHGLLAEMQTQWRERETARFQLYASCLGAALVLDIILGVLTTASRRKLRGQVDRVVIFGVTCNLVLLLLAVTAMLSRRDRLSWLHHGIVYLSALAMVAIDVFLLVWAVGS